MTAGLERSGERVDGGDRGAVGLQGEGGLGTQDVVSVIGGS